LAGHSKWSQIKRKKAVNDKQRGKMISKHIRAIQIAARDGENGDFGSGLSLKNALVAAKADDVSTDNIERAIERGLGGADGTSLESAVYEGYGPHGVAILIEALTDNRNRTAAEVRHIFSKHGGNMSGSTAWQFEAKGVIVISHADEEAQELAIDRGAADLDVESDVLTVYTSPDDLYRISEAFEEAGYTADFSQVTKVPQMETFLTERGVMQITSMLESFEDLDDVQSVYTTANLDTLGLVG
jgi:YebC/PmpR family DNA-binding regulatory protein